MSQEVMVSVLCTVYNHAPYLRQCLESLVTQETDFRYEVVVHDDASTDGSAAIIREFEAAYPDIVRPIYQTENQYSKRIPIGYTYMYPAARGKYIATCEGDDYWCDSHKLQKQFDAMEANPSCTLCVHTVQGVDVEGVPNGKFFPQVVPSEGVFRGRDLIADVLNGTAYPFQTSGYFYRKELYWPRRPETEFLFRVRTGDTVRLLYAGHHGDIFFINEIMSCYRMNVTGSWSTKNKNDLSFRVRGLCEFIAFLKEYDTYTDGAYHDLVAASIHEREFRILKNEYNVKAMKAPPYRALYRAMSLPERVCYTLVQYLPFTKGMVHALRQRMTS